MIKKREKVPNIVKYFCESQEEQIVQTAREAEEGPEESPVGEDTHRRPESNQQSDVGEDAKAAAYGDRTVSEFTHRSNGNAESGENTKIANVALLIS